MRLLVLLALLGGTLAAQPDDDVYRIVERALPLLQRSTQTFVEKRACISCHHNVAGLFAIESAWREGFDVDPSLREEMEAKTFHDLHSDKALEDALQGQFLSDTATDSQLLFSSMAAVEPRTLTRAVYALRILSWQRDGHWVTSDFRPPHSFSEITATAWALLAIRVYLPNEIEDRVGHAVAQSRTWLLAQHPTSTEEATFRLLGLRWAGAPPWEIEPAVHDLAALQKPDGGWAQTPRYASDAYSTGEAMYALRATGPVEAPWRRGKKFLQSTQAADGSWHVHTRMISPATVSPPYFETGFPYGHDEFLSYTGTAWAVAGLIGSLPSPSTTLPESWQRTALFGTAAQLSALLDSGKDPDALLPLVATDPQKLRLVLARGAKADFDTLTLAASYGGSAESLKLLLEAGAPLEPQESKKPRHTPLGFAVKTGDLASIRLLLQHGAKPDASMMSDAITFRHPEVAQALIAAGAPTGIVESSGINLLHWAAITDRPALIPVLAKAGVPINAQDENGYTPLMYAATIDFGDTGVVQELLKAGAKPDIRNFDRRTAIEQARKYKNREIETLLRQK